MMIDSMTKLGRSTPNFILFSGVDTNFSTPVRGICSIVSEKTSHHWSVVECRRESQLY